MASGWNGIRVGIKQASLVACLVVANWAFPCGAQTLTVPFTETFADGAANWKIGTISTDVPTWQSSGGPANVAFISRAGSDPDTGNQFFTTGPVLFRGLASFDASNDQFFGNWIAGGVGTFSVDVFHDHSSSLLYQIRLANPDNNPGASAVNASVLPGVWTTLTVPIVDSATAFQTYGSLGNPPNPSAFNQIFSNIGSIQIGLAAGQVGQNGLDSGVSLRMTNPSIAAVPEPGTLAALAAAAVAAGAVRLRRVRGRHAT